MTMNRILLRLFPAFCLALACLLPQRGRACNLSDITLTNAIDNANGTFTINMTVCIGYGITGFVQGADQLTGTFAFYFYGPNPVPATVLSNTPSAITSSFRGCTLNSTQMGPIGGCFSPDPCGPPYYDDIDDSVFYTDGLCDQVGYGPCTSPCDLGFTCILTTAQCGNVNQDCFNFSFVMSNLPDSIRVVGIEGAGQPFTGCYPNNDMIIAAIICPIQWGYITATPSPTSNRILWSTLQEKNTRAHEVQRLEATGEFQTLGHVPSQGDSDTEQHYSFLDPSPLPGLNQYRIRQVDTEGTESFSEIAIVSSETLAPLSWLGDAAFLSDKARPVQVSLHALDGRVLSSSTVHAQPGRNLVPFALEGLPAGMYIAQVRGEGHEATRRILKR